MLQCAQDIVRAKEETICGKPLYRRCRCWRLRRSSAGRSTPCRPKRSRCASGSACSCAGHIIAACCAASLPTGRRPAAALQTASAAVLASMTAVCVFRRSSAVLQVAMGLMLGGALAKPRRALGARCGHGLCVSSAGGHPVFPAHHLERCRFERVCRLPRGDRRAAVRSDVIM